MTDHDLTQIGIEAFGARRRMQQAIAGRIPSARISFSFLKNCRDLIRFFYLDHALAGINRYQ